MPEGVQGADPVDGMTLADRENPYVRGVSFRSLTGRFDPCTDSLKIFFQVVHLAGRLGMNYRYDR